MMYVLKRESGGNPGQSRCCESPLWTVRTKKSLADGREDVCYRAMSQKTCLFGDASFGLWG